MVETAKVHIGAHGDYRWLSFEGRVNIGDLLSACPSLVIGRFLAVTSYDSGVRKTTLEERESGWFEVGEIAYSPEVGTVDGLEFQCDGPNNAGYDEWYIFASAPRSLGALWHGNPFEGLSLGQVYPFVNLMAFALDAEGEPEDITRLFWKQMEWIQPLSYVSDSQNRLTVVTRDIEIFELLRARYLGSDSIAS